MNAKAVMIESVYGNIARYLDVGGMYMEVSEPTPNGNVFVYTSKAISYEDMDEKMKSKDTYEAKAFNTLMDMMGA